MLENRLSKGTVRRIFDDNNDGTADNDVITQLLEDASSKVDSYLAGVFELPLAQPYPHEVLRLELDVAVAMAAQRFPETLRMMDAKVLMEMAEKDLDRLRTGKTKLGVAPPDPGKNHGGTVNVPTTSASDTATNDAVLGSSSSASGGGYWNKMGDF